MVLLSHNLPRLAIVDALCGLAIARYPLKYLVTCANFLFDGRVIGDLGARLKTLPAFMERHSRRDRLEREAAFVRGIFLRYRRRFRPPNIYLGFPVEIRGGGDYLGDRLAVDLHEGDRSGGAEKDYRHNDEEPRLDEKVKDRAKEPGNADVHKLPEREGPDNLIFGVDELGILILHHLLL